MEIRVHVHTCHSHTCSLNSVKELFITRDVMTTPSVHHLPACLPVKKNYFNYGWAAITHILQYYCIAIIVSQFWSANIITMEKYCLTAISYITCVLIMQLKNAITFSLEPSSICSNISESSNLQCSCI